MLGNVEIVQLLLQQEDIDVNALDDSNRTALHLAVFKRKPEVMKILQSRQDMDKTIKDASGMTAEDISDVIREI